MCIRHIIVPFCVKGSPKCKSNIFRVAINLNTACTSANVKTTCSSINLFTRQPDLHYFDYQHLQCVRTQCILQNFPSYNPDSS